MAVSNVYKKSTAPSPLDRCRPPLERERRRFSGVTIQCCVCRASVGLYNHVVQWPIGPMCLPCRLQRKKACEINSSVRFVVLYCWLLHLDPLLCGLYTYPERIATSCQPTLTVWYRPNLRRRAHRCKKNVGDKKFKKR